MRSRVVHNESLLLSDTQHPEQYDEKCMGKPRHARSKNNYAQYESNDSYDIILILLIK